MENPFIINPMTFRGLKTQGKEKQTSQIPAVEEDNLIIEGNTIYEVDLACIKKKQGRRK